MSGGSAAKRRSPAGGDRKTAIIDAAVTVFSHHGIGKEELELSRENVPRRDERTACARQVLTGLSPECPMLDLPDLRPLVSILDAIVLP